MVEPFFGTNPNNPKGFYHLVVNPGTTANSWTVELAIPFTSLNTELPKAGTTWRRCNLARVRQSTPSENSTSCSVEGSFLAPEAFGVWRFGK